MIKLEPKPLSYQGHLFTGDLDQALELMTVIEKYKFSKVAVVRTKRGAVIVEAYKHPGQEKPTLALFKGYWLVETIHSPEKQTIAVLSSHQAQDAFDI